MINEEFAEIHSILKMVWNGRFGAMNITSIGFGVINIINLHLLMVIFVVEVTRFLKRSTLTAYAVAHNCNPNILTATI